MGRADRPRNILKTEDSSWKVIPFLQDADYYMQKGTYYHRKNRLPRALLFLQKAIEIEPENPQHHYNLACLLSKTSRLKEANQIFKHIVQHLDPQLAVCYFHMAVNHGMMEELPEAKRCLLKYLHAFPEGEMAEEAAELLLVLEEDDETEPFSQALDAHENDALLHLIADFDQVRFKERLLEEEDFRQALQRGLYQGNDLIKEAIIGLYGSADCDTARSSLAEFAANPWVNERLRQVALLELKRTAPQGRYRIFSEGSIREINLHSFPAPAPVWDSKWQQVLECTFANMRNSAFYSDEFFEDAEAIWIDFINRTYPQGPRVGKPQTWAAGLEYCLARFHFLGLTQKDLAEAYGVSAASVRRKYMRLNRVLRIDRQAYHNVLTYLKR
ncbi:MAG TPA: tetratricopeptide repeat protein [Candidatus Limnocylindrales bacterium]|nr:tetratricopeptide repeat protein [Candidatus Limnocylindrales bacterium]